MADVYEVTAKVVKVSVGPANGNQVARILRRGEVVPAGVPQGSLDVLVKRKLIKKTTVPAAPTAAEKAAADKAQAEKTTAAKK